MHHSCIRRICMYAVIVLLQAAETSPRQEGMYGKFGPFLILRPTHPNVEVYRFLALLFFLVPVELPK